MLLQRISLSNFLSYKGIPNSSGKTVPVDIDFYDSTLWLIYGPNGAGKSSIFDAISFALYKKHRGAESANHAFSYLISDGADQANIDLELALNDRKYLVQRQIKRGKKSAKVWGIVREWTGKEWKAVPNTEDNVENWVKANIRMTYETFVSAVLLRQGEADAFLKAKPRDRKERLLEVLDLNFYKRLGELAGGRRKNTRDEMKQLEQKLLTLRKISADEIQAQNELGKQIENSLAETRIELSNKDKELQDAEHVIKICNDINEREQEQNNAKKLIQRESEIVTNVKRFHELNIEIPCVQSLIEIRERIDGEINEIKVSQKSIEDGEEKLTDILAKIDKAEKELGFASKNSEVLNKQIERTQNQTVSLREQVDQIFQIETIEKQIALAESELTPYKEILKRSKQLETERERFESLKATLPLLEELSQARSILSTTQDEKENLDEDLAELLSQFEQIQLEIDKEEKSVLSLRKNKRALDSKFQSLQAQIRDLEQKIGDREKVAEQDECPICGSRLDTDNAHNRIEKEIKGWGEKLTDLRKNSKLEESTIRKLETNQKSADDNLEKLKNNLSKVGTKKAVCVNKIESARTKIRDAKNQVKKLEGKAEHWKTEIDNLEILRRESSKLEKNSKEWKQLELAHKEEVKFQTVIQTKKNDLDVLPKWSSQKRQSIKTSYDEISDRLLTIEQEAKQAQDTFRKIEKYLSDLNSQRKLTAQSIQHTRDNTRRLEERKVNEESQLSRQIAKLPARLTLHFSAIDRKFLIKLEKEKNSLANSEQEEAKLKNARDKTVKLDGQLDQLGKQLSSIPKAHHRPIDDVRAEIQEIQSRIQELQMTLNTTNEELGKMKSGQKDYEYHLDAFEKAQTQFRYYGKLADAFGNSGLQAQIIQEAQKKIKDAANTTLRHLSNGIWQIELVGDDQELEIFAQDVSQPGMPRRPFEYLSGGEKFRVAISLAVAIGQSISGGRTVDTLIIDEGFGSLDEVNRDNLVKELTRLSDEVLSGGRVIIVSHEEDICNEFAHRLRISKNADGLVSVEKFVG
jgi:exonuclease SbcC